jgi:hypothetical protein
VNDRRLETQSGTLNRTLSMHGLFIDEFGIRILAHSRMARVLHSTSSIRLLYTSINSSLNIVRRPTSKTIPSPPDTTETRRLSITFTPPSNRVLQGCDSK